MKRIGKVRIIFAIMCRFLILAHTDYIIFSSASEDANLLRDRKSHSLLLSLWLRSNAKGGILPPFGIPQPQSAQVRLRPALYPSGSAGFGRQSKDCSPSASRCSALFIRTLLVSADLTADEIPATGGHRRFVPHQDGDRPGPATGEITLLEKADKLRLPRGGYE